jgi:hypothetical protein
MMHHRRMQAFASILAGAALLLWPALYNGWPLVFSDTGAFMFAALERWPQWDKPIAYAVFLHVLSWRLTYWIAAFVQGLIVSHLVWLLCRGFGAARWHLALLAGLAATTSLPWFTSQLMPDFLAPVLVLAVLLLGLFRDAERWYLAGLVTLAAASHLSHLGLLLGLLLCLVPVRALCRLSPWPPNALPLAAATAASIALLVGSNALMWDRAVVSPYGSVFPLARQLANGPALAYLRENCPGYVICPHLDRVGTDSDRILWDRDSPLWAGGDERVMAPEASRILAGTISTYPREVAANAIRDSLAQLVKVRVGDSLIPNDLDKTVLNNLRGHLPHEVAAFVSSRQVNATLDILPAVNAIVLATLAASLLALPWLLWRSGDRRLLAATLLVCLALAGNAMITGAASKPHHRYQARIAWLLPLLAGVALAASAPPRLAAPPARSA